MVYHVTRLSECLYLFYWERDATLTEGNQFCDALADLLNKAGHKLYFISDLRDGCITQLEVMRKLSDLSAHANWGGSTSFSSPGSSVFSRFVQRLIRLHRQDDPSWGTPEQAIAYLELTSPGLTQGINWSAAIARGKNATRA